MSFFVILITSFVLNFNTTIYSQESLPNTQNHYNTESAKKTFNIAVASDWGCDENAQSTAENIQSKDPELVIAGGDASYDKSASCWFEIIQPFQSKTKIAMGDNEYSDTYGGPRGIIDQYLKPLNLAKTYYSYDLNNAHFVFIDPYISYEQGSAQYQFIENDLKTASTNPNIDWRFVVESVPMYTSPSKHPADSVIRDIYHPLFEKYNVDIVFTGSNHNYQRTFPLKYNSSDSSNPIVVKENQIAHNNKNNKNGVIFLVTGTAGRSLYELKGQAPYVVKQEDKHYGFIDIKINGKELEIDFHANANMVSGKFNYYSINYQNNLIDQFTLSKINSGINDFDKF
jgi:hypothetical protein